jgi:hypothetical protein
MVGLSSLNWTLRLFTRSREAFTHWHQGLTVDRRQSDDRHSCQRSHEAARRPMLRRSTTDAQNTSNRSVPGTKTSYTPFGPADFGLRPSNLTSECSRSGSPLFRFAQSRKNSPPLTAFKSTTSHGSFLSSMITHTSIVQLYASDSQFQSCVDRLSKISVDSPSVIRVRSDKVLASLY